MLGTLTLVLVYSAYVAEVFRAGIESVHPSQRAAARSLGLTHRQSLRLVVLPQAVRNVLPPLLNDFVALQKDVGLISVLGAVDAIRAAQIESARTFNFTPTWSPRCCSWPSPPRPGGSPTRSPAAPPAPGAARDPRARGVGSGEDLRRPRRAPRHRPDRRRTRGRHADRASGSGKSTPLRCVDLLEDIDDGRILLDGTDVSDPRADDAAARRRMGWSSSPTTCSRT